MLTIFQFLFSIITIALAGYGLLTNDSQFNVYTSLFAGLTLLVLGLQEFKSDKKFSGWFLISLFAFLMLIVSKSFMLNL